MKSSYPEIYVQVSCTSKLSVSHLKGDCHLIIFMKGFVKALSPVCCQLDIVCCCGANQAGYKQQGW